MRIIIDSREQAPYSFTHERYVGTVIESGTLQTGDYSLAGLTDRVAVERKSLPDLVMCLSKERERFERELQRAGGLDVFAVVIECAWGDLAGGRYKSRMNAHSACQSVLAFTCRYKVPFLGAGSRQGAEYAAWGFLRQYLESARKRYASIVKAHDAA
jgi:ERCC4-type nuclease